LSRGMPFGSPASDDPPLRGNFSELDALAGGSMGEV
jgi:hypothetical protein